MPLDENENFFLNRSPCVLSIEEELLVIRFVVIDEDTSNHDDHHALKIIPFCEILTTQFVDQENCPEKQKAGLNLKKKTKLPHLVVRTIKRCKDHRWKTISLKLKSPNIELCQKWEQTINIKLSEFCSFRPKNLLVFINPYGGSGGGQNVYDKKVEPVFDQAGITTKVITTDFRHHAKTYIETHDLSIYDGVVAVGGDGMLNEVINGLIYNTQSQNGISVDAKKGSPRTCPKFIRPDMKVGVIPAGSTDCVSYVTQGINDPETSALHIVLGDSHPVDVVSLHNSDGIFKQFSMSLTGYGYMGDMLRHSENYRWMGPPRYTFVGTNVFLKNKSYSGEVHYLPADGKDDPKTSSFCRTPCTTCQDGLTNEDVPLFTPLTPLSHANLECDGDALTLNFDTEKCEITDSDEAAEDIQGVDNEEIVMPAVHIDLVDSPPTSIVCDRGTEDNEVCNPTPDVITSADLKPEVSRTLNDQQETEIIITASTDGSGDGSTANSSPVRPKILALSQLQSEDEKEEWKVIRDNFMSINGVTMSCACERSPLGLSPYSHLCDGALDLIIVRSCSRFDFLRFMIAHTGKGDRFDFPFVEVHRVKAFQFVPSIPQSSPILGSKVPTPGSPSDTSGCESVHISLQELSVKYQRGKKKKQRQRSMKRSQSVIANPVSTWNSDGEIVEDPNMTVRVHRGLILLFCRGIENLNQ